jgi:hypothetical protein
VALVQSARAQEPVRAQVQPVWAQVQPAQAQQLVQVPP